MTEPVYLALFVWAAVFFSDFVRNAETPADAQSKSPLVKCGLCLAGASLTRYDGWLLAVVMAAIALLIAWQSNFAPFRPPIAKFILVAVAAPVLFFAFKALVFFNTLQLSNRPYSVRTIRLY